LEARFKRAHNTVVAVIKDRFKRGSGSKTIANRVGRTGRHQSAANFGGKTEAASRVTQSRTQAALAQAKSVMVRCIKITNACRHSFLNCRLALLIRHRPVEITDRRSSESEQR